MTLLRILTLALAVTSFSRADDLTDDLFAATRKGNLEQVKALLDKGASVNAKFSYGQTPLFFACDRGYMEIVKLLVERGADVNVEDTFYHANALSWAVDHNHGDREAAAGSWREVPGRCGDDGRANGQAGAGQSGAGQRRHSERDAFGRAGRGHEGEQDADCRHAESGRGDSAGAGEDRRTGARGSARLRGHLRRRSWRHGI